MHCLDFEAGTKLALHSLIATTLCHIDHKKVASLPDRSGSHTCDQELNSLNKN